MRLEYAFFRKSLIGLLLGCTVFAGSLSTFADVQSKQATGSHISDPKMPVMTKPLSGGVSEEAVDLTNDLTISEALARANPDDPEAHFLLGIAYSRTPYLEKAISELRRARKLAKKTPEGYALFDRKIREYENLLSQRPNDPLILYRLAFGYYMRGYGVQHDYIKDDKAVVNQYYAKAEATLRDLMEADPSDIWAKNYLGFFLIELDETANFSEAVALWEESLKTNADNPGAYMLLGEAALKQGNLRKAVEFSTKALAARNAWMDVHVKKQTTHPQ